MNELLVKEAIKLLEQARLENEKEARELTERALNFLKVALDESKMFKQIYGNSPFAAI